MRELTAEAVAAALTAAGERPAAQRESGWAVAADEATVLVSYKARGTGEAVMKREALARWMKVLGTGGHGWTVTGLGSRKLAGVRVTEPDTATAAGEAAG